MKKIIFWLRNKTYFLITKQNLFFDYETKLIFWLRNKTYFLITKQNLFLDSETKLIFWWRNKTYFLITTQNLFFDYETKLIFWLRNKTYFFIPKQKNLFFDYSSRINEVTHVPWTWSCLSDAHLSEMFWWTLYTLATACPLDCPPNTSYLPSRGSQAKHSRAAVITDTIRRGR